MYRNAKNGAAGRAVAEVERGLRGRRLRPQAYATEALARRGHRRSAGLGCAGHRGNSRQGDSTSTGGPFFLQDVFLMSLLFSKIEFDKAESGPSKICATKIQPPTRDPFHRVKQTAQAGALARHAVAVGPARVRVEGKFEAT